MNKMINVNNKTRNRKVKTMKNLIIFITLFFLPVFLFTQNDSRYDSGFNLPFNEKAGDVNPQTGNIGLSFTDVALPGRAGFDFTFSRVWALNRSGVFAMSRNPYDGKNCLTSDTIEQYNHMGVGWSTNLPYVFKDGSPGLEQTVLSLFFGGNVYELEQSTLTIDNGDNSNIRGYDLTDLRVLQKEQITYGEYAGGTMPTDPRVTDTAAGKNLYVLILKDKSKYFFRPDGKLMMMQDRTGLNRIWYFYEEYEPDKTHLVLVVDTIGREIGFYYDANKNLQRIEWTVSMGNIDSSGERSYPWQARSVQYTYVNAETTFPEIGSLAGQVINKQTPYCLMDATDPEGNVTTFTYAEGLAGFSYDTSFSLAQNAHLLLTGTTSCYTADGYKNKRCFNYELSGTPKSFYLGFMDYFRIVNQYLVDSAGAAKNNTIYHYQDLGFNGNWSSYKTIIAKGNTTTTFSYSVSEQKSRNHVLESITLTTSDGFLQRTNYSYSARRTKELEDVLRNGKPVYEERFEFDKKGNLKWQRDRLGLEVFYTYDEDFSIPIESVKKFYSEGTLKEYKTTNSVNSLGQVTEQFIYLDHNGIKEQVRTALIQYDPATGNVIKQTDNSGNETHTVYDSEYDAFPVKTWQNVTIDVNSNWLTPPEGSEVVPIRTWKVFNTDGTVWLEVDNEGFVVEHYYDKIGAETETVTPDQDDLDILPTPAEDYDDIYSEYFQGNMAAYFAARQDNPGVRKRIFYMESFVLSFADMDAGEVKINGVRENGLGKVLEEIEYNTPIPENITYQSLMLEVPYAVKTTIYDAELRMIALNDPDHGIDYTEKEVHGITVKRYDKTWIVKYDDLGRQKEVLYPKTDPYRIDVKTMLYDDYLNTVTTTDPERRMVLEKRDWNGNILKLIAYGDTTTGEEDRQTYTYTYDQLNRKVAFTDPKGIITRYFYDERDLLVRQDYGNGSDIMEYDNLGRLVKKSDRLGNVLVFAYDELGRNTEVVHYKKDGNDNDIDDFTENFIDHEVLTAYDFRGNATRIENQNLIEHFTYDHSNRLIKLERHLKNPDFRGLIASRIPETGWGTTQENQVFTFEYEYNDAGMATAMEYPDGCEHSFDYDPALGRLQSIDDGAGLFVTGFEYNKSGVVTRMNYANQTYQTWAFDNRKRIKETGVYKTGVEIMNLAYTLNGSGDILSINDNEYAYDGFDRIIGAKTLIPGQTDYAKLVTDSFGTQQGADPVIVEGTEKVYNPEADMNSDGRINGEDHRQASFITAGEMYDQESFTYDLNGNRTYLVQNGDIYRYTYGERNRLMKVELKLEGDTVYTDFIVYEYDANGNTVKRTIHRTSGDEVIEFEYDTLNRLIRTTEGTDMTDYYYDNAGNRFIKKETAAGIPESFTLYLRHGQIAVAMDIEIPEDDAEIDGKLNRYVLSGDLLAGRITTTYYADSTETTVKSYYHLDHLNSTKCVTDGTGVVEVMYEYRAFGEQLKRLDANDDETGDTAKYSYGGKELDGGTNLYYFNARYYDATIGRFINVDPVQDGINWYVYCGNNPLSMVDPTGLSDFFDVGKLMQQWGENIIKGAIDSVAFSVVNLYNSTVNAITNIFKGKSEVSVDAYVRVTDAKYKVGVTIDKNGIKPAVTNPTSPSNVFSQLQAVADSPLRVTSNDKTGIDGLELHGPYLCPVQGIVGVGIANESDAKLTAGVKAGIPVVGTAAAKVNLTVPTVGDAPTVQGGNFQNILSEDDKKRYNNAVNTVSNYGIPTL